MYILYARILDIIKPYTDEIIYTFRQHERWGTFIGV